MSKVIKDVVRVKGSPKATPRTATVTRVGKGSAGIPVPVAYNGQMDSHMLNRQPGHVNVPNTSAVIRP